MSHGKETPRQKMVGMMYLVMNALLALNISADILDAFVFVDGNLVKATDIFVEKNSSSYEIFDAQMVKAASKVEPFRDMALRVKEKSDQLTYDIQEIKVEMIKLCNGKDAEALEEMHWTIGRGENARTLKTFRYDGKKLHAKDQTDKPAQIMILGKQGENLKNKIIEYREFLLEIIEDDESVEQSIASILNTDAPPEEPGQPPHTWESSNFEQLPLVAVLTNLSKLQNNVRNAEADVIQYLLSKIDATDTKVNKMEAVVLTGSNYVLLGEQFEARVLLAAYDSLQKPEILLGKYRVTDNGYEITDGGTVLNYDEKGRAIVKRPATSAGNFTVEGLLQMQTVDGLKSYPFSRDYQVGQPSAVVSPTKMNVLYIGVDNPLSISVSGVPAEKVSVTISQGTIRPLSGSKSEYIASPTTTASDAVVTVFADIGGQRKNMGSMPFRVKIVPSPVAKVGGKSSGRIEKNVLISQTGVLADMEDFLFDLRYTVTQFTVEVSTAQGDRAYMSNSPAFTAEQKTLLNSLTKGQHVFFTNIKAKGPDGAKNLRDIIFTIN
jgi:gliding motility-associated protein GldM